MKNIIEADEAVYKVEDQWHYETMVKYGFEPVTKERTGFVRSYRYKHQETGYEIACRTGVNADYFLDFSGRVRTENNFYENLEEHLKSIS